MDISSDTINVNCLAQPVSSDKARTLAATTVITNIIQITAAALLITEAETYDSFANMIIADNNIDIANIDTIKDILEKKQF